MSSRTPIRLTPHRGPLATPSASPESSPTSSSPPSDMSFSSADSIPTLDVAVLQYKISTLSLPAQHPFEPCDYDQVSKHGPCGSESLLCPLVDIIALKSLLYSAYDLAKTLAGIVTFCLFMWGLLEMSSYVAELRRQPSPWISIPRLPLVPSTGDLRCHANAPLCEPKDQHAAVLQFLSEQIQHAKALSSLSIGLGLPLQAFFEAHRTSISRFVPPQSLQRPSVIQEVDTSANLTDILDPIHSLLDFNSGSFIGRSLSLALDELGDLTAESIVSHGVPAHGNTRLHAIYWRTTSNLLLEYSAARPRARRMLRRLDDLHRRLSPLISSYHVARDRNKTPNSWWWKDHVRQPNTSIEDDMKSFMTGLETTLDNVRRLTAYLDWITGHLAQTSLEDVLKMQHETDFLSCMLSLQDLFARTRSLTSKRLCFCINDSGDTLPAQPERVEIVVPGSPTVRAGR